MSTSMAPAVPADPKDGAQLSVGFVLLPRFTLLPFAAFVDCLRLAADEGDASRQLRCRWTVMGRRDRAVEASCGIQVTPWEDFADPAGFDYVVVVGGQLPDGPPADRETLAYLRQAAARGVPVVGLCTAAFALIQAGLMQGRRCCVSWYHYYDLLERYPDVTPVADQLFVVDGDRITCAGGAAAADLAAWIVERHMGRSWAQKSLHILLIDRARRGSTSQPQPPLYEQVADNRVRRAILLIEQHLSEPLRTEELADRVNVSRRHLERAFKEEVGMSPHQLSRHLRLRYGLWLLRHTERTITDIASECGFADTAHFSRQFRAQFGRSPSETRPDGDRERRPRVRAGSRDPAGDLFERSPGSGVR